jgi:DNA mismatch repair protein MutS
LANRIKNPLTNIKEINNRLDCVEYFKNMYPMFIDDVIPNLIKLRDNLKKCYDMERCLQRISLGRGNPRDLQQIGISLRESIAIKNYILNSENNEFSDYFLELLNNIDQNDSISFDILNTLKDDNLPYSINDGGYIKKGSNSSLDEWIQLRENGDQLICDLEKKYQKLTSIRSLKIQYNNILGYFVSIPTSQNILLKEFNLCQSTKNNLRYKTEVDINYNYS